LLEGWTDADQLHLAGPVNPDLMKALAAKKVTVLAMDAVPRLFVARAKNGRA